MKIINYLLFLTFLFLNFNCSIILAGENIQGLRNQDSLSYINDSLIKAGDVYEKNLKLKNKGIVYIENSKFDYFDHLITKKFSENEIKEKGLKVNSDAYTFGGLYELNNSYTHRDKNYNLLHKEFAAFGSCFQIINPGITFNEDVVSDPDDFSFGIGQYFNTESGYGYGWKFNNDKALMVNTKVGLNLGWAAILDNQSSSGASDENNLLIIVYNDVFNNQIEYYFSKNFDMNISVIRVRHYEEIDFLNNILSKATEVGVYAIIDNYFVDYLQSKRVAYLPIYNFLAQNLAQFAIHQLKINNNANFPFKSNGKAFNGYSIRIGGSYSF